MLLDGLDDGGPDGDGGPNGDGGPDDGGTGPNGDGFTDGGLNGDRSDVDLRGQRLLEHPQLHGRTAFVAEAEGMTLSSKTFASAFAPSG